MASSSLLTSVQQAAFSKRTGARVTQEASSGDVIVHDCPCWGKDNTRLLRFLRPDADVYVQGSTSSLSGFIVTVREPASLTVSGRVWVASATTFVLTTLLAGLHFILYYSWGLPTAAAEL